MTDTGRGIAPEFVPHVFDAFRQEEATPTRSRGGLGLGLAISRQIVELHGGRIEARSEGEGKGATFVCSLPASSGGGATPSPRRSPSDERPAQLRGLRVLVVDDEEDTRQLMRVLLEDCGCRVRIAASAAEALAAFEEEAPDVLLSDIGMPGQDGYALIQRVRALAPAKGGDVPAAALTAYARAEDRQRLLNAGFSVHLAKPIEPAELVAVVATLSRFMQKGGGGPQP